MPNLTDTLETIIQRTGQSFDLTDPHARARFLQALRTDLAVIINQLNNVYLPIVEALVDASALATGIAGTTVYTDPDTGTDSSNAYYDSSLARARTIKETFDFLLAQLAALETVVVTEETSNDWEADVAALQDLVNTLTLNLQQLRIDTQASNYTLDNDGLADLTYPLAQHLDALGQFFTNFPGVGGTYVDTYPTLELNVALSDIDIDTTLAQSVITDLPDNLDSIRDFVGMDTVGPETPEYSAHGAITYVSDGETLEEAIQTLDAAIVASSPFSTVSNVTSNVPGTEATDDFVFGSAQLDDSGSASHDSRMLFDKSTGAFRAGKVTGTQWNSASRPNGSVAFGLDSTAAADTSFCHGDTNTIDSQSGGGTILGGHSHNLQRAPYGALLGGHTNEIGDGIANCSDNGMLAGAGNSIVGTSVRCAIAGGEDIAITGASSDSGVFAGDAHTMSGAVQTVVLGGFDSTINASVTNGLIGGGTTHVMGTATNSVIVGGSGNEITSSDSSFIGGGAGHLIDSTGDYNTIIGGGTGNISGAGTRNVILAGESNIIEDGDDNVVIAGQNTTVNSGVDNATLLNVRGGGITADGVVASGNTPDAYMSGMQVHGAGAFPADATGLLGQCQTGRVLLMKETTASGFATLTTDGAAAATSNVLYIPDHGAVYAVAHWVGMLADASATTALGGTTIAVISRHAGAAVIEGYVQNESKSSGGTNNITSFGLGGTFGTGQSAQFVVSGLGNGYVEFQIDFGPGVGVTARATASIEWVQVRGDF